MDDESSSGATPLPRSRNSAFRIREPAALSFTESARRERPSTASVVASAVIVSIKTGGGAEPRAANASASAIAA